MEWKDISVFISSTFNDMHAERDYILKNVFPQLGEWCERRHIFLRDIDLRWGVTPKDSQTQNTIYKCLTAVDSCRPFFLCFLGQRRGWVPTLDRINVRTRDTFPEIVEMARSESRSATEYEIEHALLMPLACFENGALRRKEPVKNALFLRRRPDYLPALSEAQKKIFLDWHPEKCATPEGRENFLRICREANETTYRRISEKNLVLDYDCRWDRSVTSPELASDDPEDDRARGRLTGFTIRAGDLPHALRRELLDILRSEFPDEVPAGEIWPLKAYLLAAYVRQFLPYAGTEEPASGRYARDREQQRVFLSTCLRDAVPRSDALEALNAYCDGDSRFPLLVLAASGMGKTTLSAQFVRQRKDPLISRFLGMSELSGSLLPLWESILSEAGIPAPPDLDTLRAQLPSYLAAMAPRILLLDGLEQIPGGLDLPDLLPVPLPEGIRVILTVRSDLEGLQPDRFLRFHPEYPHRELLPFSPEQRKELVETNLRTSLKELSPELMDLVCTLDESGNPLYLAILLSDIRSFGSSSRLQKEIERHGSTPFSAFDAFLSRMENDRLFDMLSPARCVPLVFGLLAAARDGLSYEELTDLLAEAFPEESRERCAGSLQICLRQVRGFLRRFDGRTDFRHQAFRAAAQSRYASREREFHTMLARLFRAECDPHGDGSFSVRDARALREYAWQLSFVSKADHVRLYGDVCWLNARCAGSSVRDLIREYDDPALNAQKPLRDLLIRYREGLESDPDLLPSLLWAYVGKESRENAGFDRLRCSWLRSEGLPEEPAEVPSAEGPAGLQVLGDSRYHAAAFCFGGDTHFAFAFTGQGQITAYDLRNGLPLDNPLFTAKSMPLGLCASSAMLAAAFENGKIELYEWETDGSTLRSRSLAALSYLPPIYSGAALCFDGRGLLWFQSEEETLASFDPVTGNTAGCPLPGAEEISSFAPAGDCLYGTACAGQDTLLFCLDGSGAVRTRGLGRGDSRVLCADERGCLVTCPASGGVYPLLLVDDRLETVRESGLESPVTAALPMEDSWLLLPAKQTLGRLWRWDGKDCVSVEQQLLYQDQAQLGRLQDGSFALLSAGAITRFAFTGASSQCETEGPGGTGLSLEDLPDLRRYELRDVKLYSAGDYACAAGVSMSMRSVRDEQAAGAVFLKKAPGGWKILGDRTWPRSCELVRTVCIDPEQGCYTLLFRSEESIRFVQAIRGTAEELCAGGGLARELRLPQNGTNAGCFADGKLFLSADGLLQVYDAQTLRYETALLLPSPVTALLPDGDRVIIHFGNQRIIAKTQKGRYDERLYQRYLYPAHTGGPHFGRRPVL